MTPPEPAPMREDVEYAARSEMEQKFWSIVDRDGLSGLPSDMWDALDRLVLAWNRQAFAAAPMREDVTLLPCPFCGSINPELIGMIDSGYVECGSCLATMPEHDPDVPNSIQRWNTRLTHTARPDAGDEVERVARIIELAIVRHGVAESDLEGTLDDATIALAAMREGVDRQRTLDAIQAETYRDMHGIATIELGYPSILEALEAAPECAREGVDRGMVGRPIGTEPHACTVLGGRFDDTVGVWTFGVVNTPLSKPFTHWWPLPGFDDTEVVTLSAALSRKGE